MCDAQKREDSTWCKNISEKTIEYIFKFQINDDSLYLDSALVYTNKGLEKCNKYKILFSFRKLDILSKKKEYLQAISFIKSIEYPLIPELPYFNRYLLNRYKAMEYHLKKENIKRDNCLKIIISELDEYMNKNEEKLNSLLVLKDFKSILNNPEWITYTQYFYTKSILYGYPKTKLELDSCQNSLNGNKKLFEYIDNQCKENDFLNYFGF